MNTIDNVTSVFSPGQFKVCNRAHTVKTLLPLGIAIAIATALPGQTKYQDQPMGLTRKGIELIARYEKQARDSLPRFDVELTNPEGRQFFVVTKLLGEGTFEQVFVQVDSREGEVYVGRIASDPIGPVKFKRGAPIRVGIADTVDWCIVTREGEEIGNLTGKAMDALQAGAVAFIIQMRPEDGRFTDFKVVSVRNPQTQQEIREIVPDDVVARIEKRAKKRFGKQKSDDDSEKFQYVIARFPTWEIIER